MIFSNLRLRNIQPMCPICGMSGRAFTPLPQAHREQALKYGYPYMGKGETISLETYGCPQCNASDRERLYAHWLQIWIDAAILGRNIRVIHFAPEHMLSTYIQQLKLFEQYETADLMMENVTHRHVDLMQLPFAANTYDFLLCSHVLEHVPDDAKALQELYRILKPGGAGLIMAPIIPELPMTIEDPAETSAEVRWRRFGQDDHVRLYAHDDYVRRIENAGFAVKQFGVDYFGSDTFTALGLKASSLLYVALKPVVV